LKEEGLSVSSCEEDRHRACAKSYRSASRTVGETHPKLKGTHSQIGLTRKRGEKMGGRGGGSGFKTVKPPLKNGGRKLKIRRSCIDQAKLGWMSLKSGRGGGDERLSDGSAFSTIGGKKEKVV